MKPAYRPSDLRLVLDPSTGRFHYARPMAMRVGAAPAPAAQQPPLEATPTPGESFSMADLSSAFTHAITPSLILVGIATGAATALGWVLVTKYVFKDRGR